MLLTYMAKQVGGLGGGRRSHYSRPVETPKRRRGGSYDFLFFSSVWYYRNRCFHLYFP